MDIRQLGEQSGVRPRNVGGCVGLVRLPKFCRLFGPWPILGEDIAAHVPLVRRLVSDHGLNHRRAANPIARAQLGAQFAAAYRRKYFTATIISFGHGAVMVTGVSLIGWVMVNSSACNATRVINGFSTACGFKRY